MDSMEMINEIVWEVDEFQKEGYFACSAPASWESLHEKLRADIIPIRQGYKATKATKATKHGIDPLRGLTLTPLQPLSQQAAILQGYKATILQHHKATRLPASTLH